MSLLLSDQTLEGFIDKNHEYLEESYIFSVENKEISFEDWCKLIYNHHTCHTLIKNA